MKWTKSWRRDVFLWEKGVDKELTDSLLEKRVGILILNHFSCAKCSEFSSDAHQRRWKERFFINCLVYLPIKKFISTLLHYTFFPSPLFSFAFALCWEAHARTLPRLRVYRCFALNFNSSFLQSFILRFHLFSEESALFFLFHLSLLNNSSFISVFPSFVCTEK